MSGRVASINRSGGGVPKLAIDRAHVRVDGLDGDRQANRKYHGGPDRALCLYSLERLDALAMEGHPVSPGSLGENLTISGLDWNEAVPGARFVIGEGAKAVEIELTAFAAPCRTIRHAFLDEGFTRISQKLHPGWSRVYARVVREGVIRAGDPVIAVR